MAKRIFIQINTTPELKNKWKSYTGKGKRFSTLTSLIKYCVNGYILGELIEKNTFHSTEKQHLIETLQESENLVLEQEKLLHELRDLRVNQSKIHEIIKDYEGDELEFQRSDTKGQILEILQIGKAKRKQIAKLIKLKEKETQLILNEIQFKDKLIEVDKNYNYYIAGD